MCVCVCVCVRERESVREKDRERCVCVLFVLVIMREKDCVVEGECVGICTCVYMEQRVRHVRV